MSESTRMEPTDRVPSTGKLEDSLRDIVAANTSRASENETERTKDIIYSIEV